MRFRHRTIWTTNFLPSWTLYIIFSNLIIHAITHFVIILYVLAVSFSPAFAWCNGSAQILTLFRLNLFPNRLKHFYDFTNENSLFDSLFLKMWAPFLNLILLKSSYLATSMFATKTCYGSETLTARAKQLNYLQSAMLLQTVLGRTFIPLRLFP